jgi:hypothetical protein
MQALRLIACNNRTPGDRNRFAGVIISFASGGVMQKARAAIAALVVLAWSGIAWAVVDTSVTITNEGKPVPEATVSLSTSEGPPPRAHK